MLQSVVAFGSDGRYTTERVMFCDVSRIDYSARRRYTLPRGRETIGHKNKKIEKRERCEICESARIFAKEEKWKKLGSWGGIPPASTSRKKKKEKGAKIFKTKQNKARARDKRNHPSSDKKMRGGKILFALTLLALLCETILCDNKDDSSFSVVVVDDDDDNDETIRKTKIATKGKDVPWNKVEEESRFHVRGYPKYAIWRTFDAIEVTLKDSDGSVNANQCVLKVGKEEAEVEEEGEGEESPLSSSKFENSKTVKSWQYRRVKMKRDRRRMKK